MEHESIIFTIFFLAIGPLKTIPAFGKLTQKADRAFKREVAIKAALLATAIALILALVGRGMLSRYDISRNAVQIGAGIILLISSLNNIFRNPNNPILRLRNQLLSIWQFPQQPLLSFHPLVLR